MAHATTRGPLVARMASWSAKWLSRVTNAIRLRNLPAHRRRVRRSRAVLAELRAMRGEATAARAFGYLRQVDPLVCEELVLSALEDAGAFVLRNRRYSGDGGVDGRCWLPGAGWGLHAVQIKRYDAAVTPSHVAAFAELVGRGRWAGGLFVHCGRTGPTSYTALRGTRLVLVSGDALLRLLIDKQLLPRGCVSPRPPTPWSSSRARHKSAAASRARSGTSDAALANQVQRPRQ